MRRPLLKCVLFHRVKDKDEDDVKPDLSSDPENLRALDDKINKINILERILEEGINDLSDD